MIFVQQKQWNKVREAMENADDALIVEGYPVHEPRFAGITVYATQVTTKALHAAKRKEQPAAPVNEMLACQPHQCGTLRCCPRVRHGAYYPW
jgi:hypothetical protein